MTNSFLGSTIWNLFLASVPVALGLLIGWASEWRDKLSLKLVIAAMLLVWLVFLPNTCYLLTEWRHYLNRLDRYDLYMQSHLSQRSTLMLMFDTVFYFCYSAVGLLAFALAIRPVANVVKREGGRPWIWGIGLFLLVSLGVYLGLILRFNSWDLIMRPGTVWYAASSVATRPLLAMFIIAFAGVLWLIYLAIDIWFDGLAMRRRVISNQRG